MRSLERDPGDIDPGDRDQGDYDPTDLGLSLPRPARVSLSLVGKTEVPIVPLKPTPYGIQSITTVKALLAKSSPAPKEAGAGLRQAKVRGSWRATPEPFRRLVARSAGLAEDVINKADRDLTESEKTLIRAAAQRLKERADALFSI